MPTKKTPHLAPVEPESPRPPSPAATSALRAVGSGRAPGRRRHFWLGLLGLAWVALVTLMPTPAWAHATLISSTPTQGAVLGALP